jgi:hypothetical protein
MFRKFVVGLATISALLVRMVEVSPESFYPSYLSSNKVNRISMQQMTFTREIMLFVRVHNPNKHHFRVTKRLRDGDKPEDYTDRILFEGNKEYKHFQMIFPKEYNKFYQVMVMLDYGDRFPMLRLGYFDVIYRNSE